MSEISKTILLAVIAGLLIALVAGNITGNTVARNTVWTVNSDCLSTITVKYSSRCSGDSVRQVEHLCDDGTKVTAGQVTAGCYSKNEWMTSGKTACAGKCRAASTPTYYTKAEVDTMIDNSIQKTFDIIGNKCHNVQVGSTWPGAVSYGNNACKSNEKCFAVFVRSFANLGHSQLLSCNEPVYSNEVYDVICCPL